MFRKLALLVPPALLLCLLGGKSAQGGSPGALGKLHDEPAEHGKGEALVTDSAAIAALARLEGPAPCQGGVAAEMFACSGVQLQSHVRLDLLMTGASSASNLWGFLDLNDGREYAVVGLNTGTAAVDVTDPSRPAVIGAVPGPPSPWREVKVYQVYLPDERRYRAYAYVVTEAPTAGLQILDLSDLPGRISLAATYYGFDTAHTVTLANVNPATGFANGGLVRPVLYLQGARNPLTGIAALDISNPLSPSLLGTYTRSYGHDTWTGIVTGSRASACLPGHDPCEIVVNWAGSGVQILDWTDKANPYVVSELFYAGIGYAHSGWISEDGNFLFNMDELDEKNSGGKTLVRGIDIHDLRDPFVAGTWMGATGAIEHNAYTIGNRLYMSHYERGLTVLDVSDPRAPRDSAFFDTFPASDNAAFHGAWGVYPYLPSGNVLLSNIDGAAGLFVLRETAVPPPAPRFPVVRRPIRLPRNG